jgi:hypothetical protein
MIAYVRAQCNCTAIAPSYIKMVCIHCSFYGAYAVLTVVLYLHNGILDRACARAAHVTLAQELETKLRADRTRLAVKISIHIINAS